MALSWGDVFDIVERTTYKPGWGISLVPARQCCDPAAEACDPNGYWLSVTASVPDSRNSGYTPIAWRTPIPEGALQEKAALLDFISKSILGLERHEMDEWLAFDGLTINNPHKGVGQAKVTQVDPFLVDL